MTTVRTVYADRLEVLTRGGLVEGQLATWEAERGRRASRWRRTHGRLYAGRSPWAVLVSAVLAVVTLMIYADRALGMALRLQLRMVGVVGTASAIGVCIAAMIMVLTVIINRVAEREAAR